jgi:hypothetical protein
VQVLATAAHEEGVLLDRAARVYAGLLHGFLERRVPKGLRELLRGEQVGHFARVQNAIHVLQEGLADDLGVVEHEHRGLVLLASQQHHVFHVVFPLGHAVARVDLDLKQLEVSDGDRERGEALAAAPADPHEKRVPVGLVDDARNPRHVFDGVSEEHQRHGLFGHRVEVV